MNWTKLWLPIFEERYTEILDLVEKAMKDDPEHFYDKKIYKFWECVTDTIENRIFIEPTSSEFLLGNTLGRDNRSWKRAKKGLPNRYRLFFKCTTESNSIILAWLNDDKTLRKAGAKTDVYTVFKKKLANGEVPSDITSLLSDSSKVKLN